jgi:predicted nucleotidyltransferase
MSDNVNDILQEYVQGLIEVVGTPLKQIILYGSYAKGNQSEGNEYSDIDIMILVDLSDNEIKDLEMEIFDYTYEMDLKHNVLFSPIIENMDNYSQRANYMPFYKNVKMEGVVLNG